MSYSIYVDPDLADYIPTFVDNRKKELRQAQSDLDAKNYENLRALGHTLKGCSASYGFVELGELGKKLEEAAKAEKSEEIATLLKDMNWLLDHYQVVENPPQPEL